MQFLKHVMNAARATSSAVAMLFVIALPAMALTLQDAQPPVRVQVETAPTTTVWYADPLWLTIGGLVLLLVIIFAVMAGRRDSTTTVVR